MGQKWSNDPVGNRMIAVHTAMSIVAIAGREKAGSFMEQVRG